MQKQILVVGSINLDLVARVPRFPAPGETISGTGFQTYPGGKGANQAVALGRLGAPVAMVGKLGNDIFAARLRASLREAHVDTRYVSTVEGPSGTALIASSHSAENTIIIISGANGQVREADLEILREVVANSSMVLAQLEIPLSTVLSLGAIARAYEVPFMLDPAPAVALPRELLECVTWLTPNQTEAQVLLGMNPTELSAAQAPAIAACLLEAGARNVALKMGSAGVFLAGDDTTPELVPAFAVQAQDTTAAGDCFNGAFAYALAHRKLAPPVAARFANAAAALSVTRLGAQTSMPALPEVEDFLTTHS